MLHLRATRFHLFRSCAIQMFSVATCFLCRIDNCDPCVVCFAFVRFKCHGCATFLSIQLQVLEFHQAWSSGGMDGLVVARGQQGQDPGRGCEDNKAKIQAVVWRD